MLGLEELGLVGWGLGSWNRLDKDQLGVDKIEWKLEWISLSTKEEVGIGIQWLWGW